MTTKPQQPDPLQPVLDDAQSELSRRLHEACVAESSGLATKTSEEIREIEDSLLAAAVAAGQTIALRKHMKEREDAAQEAEAQQAKQQQRRDERTANEAVAAAAEKPAAAEVPPPHPVTTVREFRDSNGQMWRAWSVTPGLSRTGRPKHYLGDFQQGWICFESLDSSSRRRLPCAPARLAETREEELERLLLEAITAPERKGLHKPH
jgi:hypothetical protein